MVPVPLITEKIAEVIQLVAFTVPQIKEEIEDVVQPMPHEGTHELCVEQTGVFTVLQTNGGNREGFQLVPEKRSRKRIMQQTCLSPVPQIVEEMVEASQPVLQDGIQIRVVDAAAADAAAPGGKRHRRRRRNGQQQTLTWICWRQTSNARGWSRSSSRGTRNALAGTRS